MARPKKQNAIVYYSVISKVLPLLFLIPLFLVTSIFTRADTLTWFSQIGINLTVESIFFTVLLSYTGIIFLIETIQHLPDVNTGNPIGLFGSAMLGVIALGCFIFAGAVFTDIYDPIADSGEFNIVLSIIMGLAIAMFIVQAREEIFHYRRFNMNMLSL